MAKNKKPTGGQHKTKRINVGMPDEWHAVLRKVAAHHRQPVLFALIALVSEEATKLGIPELPKLPWEVEESGE